MSDNSKKMPSPKFIEDLKNDKTAQKVVTDMQISPDLRATMKEIQGKTAAREEIASAPYSSHAELQNPQASAQAQILEELRHIRTLVEKLLQKNN